MDTSQQAIQVRGSGSKPCLPAGRRRFRSVEEKRRIVEETLVPGASVARVARAHGVNANQVFGWRQLYRQGRLERKESDASSLLPVRVTDTTVVRPARRVEERWLEGTLSRASNSACDPRCAVEWLEPGADNVRGLGSSDRLPWLCVGERTDIGCSRTYDLAVSILLDRVCYPADGPA